ncbi:tetratricopeptide repeat protein [Lutibacter sp.]|uniref:tetratricopeptide repeat protein n=1 Tax=Lutibacter sp. TaxID=1925666 RepID=UPI0025C73A0F|nr:tetratricopeptide repeat protein [Lutibacter sp.]MCF6182409.1 tetratricopeptide repeat protein [Lutibacter sp.]
MRKVLFLLLCFFSLHFYAQENTLAYQYYRNGEYKKAAVIYKTLHEKNEYNTNYLTYLINCYLQLEKFNEVKSTINQQLKSFSNQKYLYVNLGYSYQLQHQQEKANLYYKKALKEIEIFPNLGYIIGSTFKNYNLLDNALKAYKKAMELNKNTNYNFQIAAIYGEKGDVEAMFSTYLNLIDINENYVPTVKSYIGKFITDNSENKYNILFKKLILKRLQNNPQNSWNQLLSWLYMQQKDYGKAFIQEKALFKRNNLGLNSLMTLGKISFENKDYSNANTCFNYILENTNEVKTVLNAKLYLLEISLKTNRTNDKIEAQFQNIFSEFGINTETIDIQIFYVHFLAFNKNEPKKAITVLKKALNLATNKFQKGTIKIKLADILVYTNKFNTALIYYTQVQHNLKNHPIAQQARFKIAQTSYFKGDFKWAQTQLKVLKNATSQLIANDALALNLLITDNAVKDSLHIALKTYAKADLLAYQNQNLKAIDTLQTILNKFKGHPINDETLFKQAELFIKTNQFEKAVRNYLQIISLNKEDILADDAVYNLAELYENQLNLPNQAKEYYKKIIFEYPSSIFLVDARKKYRKLRGDTIN